VKVVLKSGSAAGFQDFLAQVPAGKVIFEEGDVGTEMYVIQSGTVELMKRTRRGDGKNVATLEKGDFFGEMSILEGLPRTVSAEAVEDAELIEINSMTFDKMLRHNTEIAVRMLRKLSRRLRETTKLLEETTGMAPSLDEASEVSMSSASRHRTRRLVAEGGEEFFLSSEDETTVGRVDPVTGIRPDVDLAQLDNQRSVSRRHSKIIRSGSGFVVVEEIGTMNGTFVNGVRIQTGQPVSIKDGDRLRFGLVDLTFRAKRG
jgi:CRP/FNR family cyclic AMP-dependent transcriptional regulator